MITENIPGRYGFSLPRAFQRWSQNCCSPSGSLAIFFCARPADWQSSCILFGKISKQMTPQSAREARQKMFSYKLVLTNINKFANCKTVESRLLLSRSIHAVPVQ